MPKVAVLHTSFVFISVEPIVKDLLADLLPDAEIIHFVDSDVLATVVRENGISAQSEERMAYLAKAAEAAGADVIFSACSSLGPAIELAARGVNVPVIKIDDAMANAAARRGNSIGVLATVPTTLGPTADLILAKATELGRTVAIDRALCDGAFDVLMSGDRGRHDAMVLDRARSLAENVDLIVLAQASMARLASEIEKAASVPVLASPQMGVEYLAKVVSELPA